MSKVSFGPLFLSVGASKCGTTWLYSVLQTHPQLCFTPEKEVHYFHHRYGADHVLNARTRLTRVKRRVYDRLDPARANIAKARAEAQFVQAYLADPTDDAWFASLFEDRPAGAYACDFSNFHALLPAHAWPEIAAQAAPLRVLFTMRDPLARLWSHVKFHLQMTGKEAALAAWQQQDYWDFARQPFIWENCEYGQMLRRLRAGLPEGALHVQFFEEMLEQPEASLRALEQFLEISPHAYDSKRLARRVNPSQAHPMPAFFPDLFAEELARITHEVRALGYAVPERWQS